MFDQFTETDQDSIEYYKSLDTEKLMFNIEACHLILSSRGKVPRIQLEETISVIREILLNRNAIN